MSVFVVGLNGCRLMPVSERKARLLLDGGKASVYRKVPFTIKLNYKTGSTTQPGYLGIDTGSQHIGVSVVREDGTVLHKEEISLRDSMTKRKLLETKTSLRRGRRYRKTRYRHPKWRPKTKRVYCEVPDKKRTALAETEEHVHIQKTGRMASAVPAVKDRPPYPVDQEAAGPSPGRVPPFHRAGTFRPGPHEGPGDTR